MKLHPTSADVKPLRFTNGNAKVDAAVFLFSLPAGHLCPFADRCLAKADRDDGTITDGPRTQFRCYAATDEARRPNVRSLRWQNFAALRGAKTRKAMSTLLLDSLSDLAGVVRIHESGDFFSQAYFDAWLDVVRARPQTRFYAYTKALSFWLRRRDELPDNVALTASFGGTHDELIVENGLRFALVVDSIEQAHALQLRIDVDDRLAMQRGPSFALLIHGTQPKGSPMMKAVTRLKARGEHGHGKIADRIRAWKRDLAAAHS